MQALGAGQLSQWSFPTISEGGMSIIIPIVQRRKQRLGEVKLLAQDHMTTESGLDLQLPSARPKPHIVITE